MILFVIGSSVQKVLADKGPRTVKESDENLWNNRHPKGDNTSLKKRSLGRYPCAILLGQKYVGTKVNLYTTLTHKIRDDKNKCYPRNVKLHILFSIIIIIIIIIVHAVAVKGNT
jgi:hypothetical protein